MKKYQQIENNLISMFNSNKICPGEQLPTEDEFCKLYNVSRITIRKALDSLLEKKLIKKTTGKGTFYIGDSKKEKTNITIALILCNIVSEISKIIDGVESIQKNTNVKILVYNTNESEKKEKEICERVISEGINGIIIMPTSSDSNKSFFYNLKKMKYPIVFIDRSPIEGNLIESNNEEGMYRLTELVINYGHKQIGYITGFDVNTQIERIHGFTKALNDNNYPINKNLITKLSRSQYVIYKDKNEIDVKLDALLQYSPTAIICSNDIIAIQIMNKLSERNIKDISVVGFDNTEESNRLIYSLTTVEQNFYEVGRQAGITLNNIINQKNSIVYKILIPTKLIIRKSLKPI